jgi:hypothetical protein
MSTRNVNSAPGSGARWRTAGARSTLRSVDGPSTTDWISAATSVVQAVAIVFAGVFAYYKFLRGRTFAYRAEPTASAELVQVGGGDALRVRAILRNTGPSKIPMRLKRLRVFALDPSTPAEVVWERVTTVDVFAEHHWVESQETIADEVLVSLQPMAGAGAPQAYRIELVMFSRPRRRLWTPWRTRVLRWSTEAVVVRERSQKGIWGKLWS